MTHAPVAAVVKKDLASKFLWAFGIGIVLSVPFRYWHHSVDIPRRRDYYRQLAKSDNKYNHDGLADKIEQWNTLRNQ